MLNAWAKAALGLILAAVAAVAIVVSSETAQAQPACYGPGEEVWALKGVPRCPSPACYYPGDDRWAAWGVPRCPAPACYLPGDERWAAWGVPACPPPACYKPGQEYWQSAGVPACPACYMPDQQSFASAGVPPCARPACYKAENKIWALFGVPMCPACYMPGQESFASEGIARCAAPACYKPGQEIWASWGTPACPACYMPGQESYASQGVPRCTAPACYVPGDERWAVWGVPRCQAPACYKPGEEYWQSAGVSACPACYGPGQEGLATAGVPRCTAPACYNPGEQMWAAWGVPACPTQPSGNALTRTAAFEYDPVTGLLTKEIVEPDSPQLRLETAYGHDAFGNRQTATVSSPATGIEAITARTSTDTYDAQGRFATTAANALNHSETRAFDPRFGGAISLTGPNALTTQWQYDSLGRKTLEIRADGTRTKWEYFYCNGINGSARPCPVFAKYLVAVTQLASDGTTQIGPTQLTLFDGLGREVWGYTQGFNGEDIWTTKQYDALGRQTHESRPYFGGDTPTWIVQQYDVLGRVTRQTQADNSHTDFTYAGLVTTTTNDLGQTRTETRDSQGRVRQVRDARGGITQLWYDPFGNPVKTQDAAGNITTISYDIRGRKVAMSDPNMGGWTYVYDALGQLVRQTDAKAQTSSVSYDKLGRLTGRSEPDLASTWTYDTAAKGVGKLASASANNGYQRIHTYDALGRPAQVAITIDGTTSTVATTYDSFSRINTVTYPSGFAVRHAYTALGYLSAVHNNTTNALYWRADTVNAEGQLTAFAHGNNVATTQNFNNLTGRLTSIQAGPSAAVSNLTYSWDTIGNLQWRKDAGNGLEEVFQYDVLNRLTQAAITGGQTKTYQYDSIGNITHKSDTGDYIYPASGQARPNAVASISGTLNTTFTYDANGNMLTGSGRTLTWTSFNMPATIQRGANTLSFAYDSEHGRIKQVTPSGTTFYINDPASGVRIEKEVGSGTTRWKNYIFAAGGAVAVFYENSSGPNQTRYFHKDHLGSIAAITDETGTVVERLSYDAWGKRRYPNGTDDPTGAITSQTDRGFTGHEHLEEVALVHMNGRVYDPELGRFLSADPFVQDEFDSQAFNRYSYVGNNPLAYTDPSGFFLKGLFKAIGKFFTKFWKPIVTTVVAIVVAIVMPQLLPSLAALGTMGSVVTGALTGFVSNAITSGFDPRSMILGAISGFLGSALGGGLGELGAELGGVFDGVALNAAREGGWAAFGGKLGEGLGEAAVDKLARRIAKHNAEASLGGTHLGSGNFANGAFTPAFEYTAGGNSAAVPINGVIVGPMGPSVFSNIPTALEWAGLGAAAGAAGGALAGAPAGGFLTVVGGGGPGAVLGAGAVAGGALNGAILGATAGFFGGLMVDVYDSIMQAKQWKQDKKETEGGHTKGARESTRGKHEAGDARRKLDKGGERGDDRRRPHLKRPEKWRGPWPPKD